MNKKIARNLSLVALLGVGTLFLSSQQAKADPNCNTPACQACAAYYYGLYQTCLANGGNELSCQIIINEAAAICTQL